MAFADLIASLLPTAARPLGGRPTPSVDAYLLNGLSDLVGDEASRPVRRLGPNLFAHGNRFILVRYAVAAELEVLEASRRDAVYYVIDDDFGAVAADPSLPRAYRRRIAAFAGLVLPRILALDPTIVAPNRRLFEAFPGRQALLLEPAHGPLCTDFGHFEHTAPLRLVFAGTRSHAVDLRGVAEGVTRFLDGHPAARLVTFLGRSAPRPLDRHPQVDNRKALDWPEFKAVMAGERFHLALAPFDPTPANEARSANKINDHAAFGAVGLYGRIAPYVDCITHGRDGFLLEHAPSVWHDALTELAASPHRMRAIAEAGLALARRHGDPARLRRFWLQRLAIG